MAFHRIAAVGAIIIGFLGLVLAMNAMLGGEETAAGVILASSALAFGFVIIGSAVGRNT